MTFWLAAGALSALAIALLVWPLLRRPAETAPRQAHDLQVYRDQLAEIAREAAEGNLGAEQAAAARLEIERRMLAITETGADAPGGPETPVPIDRAVTWSLAVALGFAVPLTAIGLYLVLGNPGLPSMPFAGRPAPEAPAENAAEVQMEELTAGLAARLAEDPDNRAGWLLLGRSYAQIERFDAAAQAYRRAIALGFDDATLQGALGEALAAQAGGTIGPEARNAFAAALVHDPNDPRARYYAGLALAQDGRAQAAIDIWLGLLRESTAEAPWRPVVAQQIREAAASLGIEAPEMPVATDLGAQEGTQTGSSPGPGPGPDAGDVEAAGQMSAEDRAAFIRSMVARLAERLEAEPGDFQGWLRLARAYGVLGEDYNARDALTRAEAAIRELPGETPERAQLEAAREALQGAP